MQNNLKQLREARGMSQEQAASAMGTTRNQYVKLERGPEKGGRRLHGDWIDRAARAFGVDPGEIVSNIVDGMRIAPGLRPEPNTTIPRNPEPVDLRRFAGPRVVPVYGISLGGAKGKGDFRFNGETIDRFPLPPGVAHREDLYGTYVGGDSMYPAWRDGARIYVDPKRRPAVGDDVIVELYPEGDVDMGEPGEAFIKRLVRLTPTQIIVEQFNPPMELAFDRDNVKLMHRVIPVDELLGV